MYKAQDEVFEFRGMTLVCKRAPRQLWPCQCCALSAVCGDFTPDDGHPECLAHRRQDSAQVVFYHSDQAGRRPRRRSKEA